MTAQKSFTTTVTDSAAAARCRFGKPPRLPKLFGDAGGHAHQQTQGRSRDVEASGGGVDPVDGVRPKK